MVLDNLDVSLHSIASVEIIQFPVVSSDKFGNKNANFNVRFIEKIKILQILTTMLTTLYSIPIRHGIEKFIASLFRMIGIF